MLMTTNSTVAAIQTMLCRSAIRVGAARSARRSVVWSASPGIVNQKYPQTTATGIAITE